MSEYEIGKEIGRLVSIVENLQKGKSCNCQGKPDSSTLNSNGNTGIPSTSINNFEYLRFIGGLTPQAVSLGGIGSVAGESYIVNLPAGKSLHYECDLNGGFESAILCASSLDASVISKNWIYHGRNPAQDIFEVARDRTLTFSGGFKQCYPGNCSEYPWMVAWMYIVKETSNYVELSWSIYQSDKSQREMGVKITIA